MRRRAFITLLGSAAAAWPLAARAQQAAVPVIGFIDHRSPDALAERLRGLRQGLRDAAFSEGANVAIEYRWAEGRYDRLPELAADLVRRPVTVIVASGGPTVASIVKAATTTIPVVFLAAQDPVSLGLVASLARPGGNLTGINFFSAELTAKRLELLRELVPGTARIAVLVNASNVANSAITLRDLEPAAQAPGLQLQILKASTTREINETFAKFGRERPDALFVGSDALFDSRRVQLVQLAAHYRVPATYSGREYAEVGGLMSYGSDIGDAYRQVGIYIGRILKGAKPAELPIVQASKLQLVINRQTATMLGFEVPPSLLAIADEVIE
jgi:putative tryptophan/tyrosine transport system substrate-binding protein